MKRVIHFELQVANPEKAAQFYTEVFGWKFTKWDGPEEYWLITTGENGEPGIDGGLMRSNDGTAKTTNTISVPSADEYIARVVEHGGKVIEPKMAVPGIGYMAYLQDTGGAIFGIMQNDPSAK